MYGSRCSDSSLGAGGKSVMAGSVRPGCWPNHARVSDVDLRAKQYTATRQSRRGPYAIICRPTVPAQLVPWVVIVISAACSVVDRGCEA
jgi:hypothetical protein